MERVRSVNENGVQAPCAALAEQAAALYVGSARGFFRMRA
jgi:hypothetical protein